MKKCSKCLEEKEIVYFLKKGNICKKCRLEYAKEYRRKNKDRIDKYNNENAERISSYRKSDRRKEVTKKYRDKNKEKLRIKKKEWENKNRDKINIRQKAWREKNIEKISKKRSLYIKNRKKDPLYKLICTIGSSIKISIIRNGFSKKSKTPEILGCTFEEFKIHIESKFDENMNWVNHGEYWHLDHIIPISWAKTEEEVYKLNHYTNFQPLHKKENQSKGNRYFG